MCYVRERHRDREIDRGGRGRGRENRREGERERESVKYEKILILLSTQGNIFFLHLGQETRIPGGSKAVAGGGGRPSSGSW